MVAVLAYDIKDFKIYIMDIWSHKLIGIYTAHRPTKLNTTPKPGEKLLPLKPPPQNFGMFERCIK